MNALGVCRVKREDLLGRHPGFDVVNGNLFLLVPLSCSRSICSSLAAQGVQCRGGDEVALENDDLAALAVIV